MKRILAALLIALTLCGVSSAQVSPIQPFTPVGNTATFTAATSCPSPVAPNPTGTSSSTQYVLTNIGSQVVFVSYGTSAQATTNCVIPTGTTQQVFVLLPLTQITITTYGQSYFTGITSTGTSIVYVQAGVGM
jgi:hypothetical protein